MVLQYTGKNIFHISNFCVTDSEIMYLFYLISIIKIAQYIIHSI